MIISIFTFYALISPYNWYNHLLIEKGKEIINEKEKIEKQNNLKNQINSPNPLLLRK